MKSKLPLSILCLIFVSIGQNQVQKKNDSETSGNQIDLDRKKPQI